MPTAKAAFRKTLGRVDGVLSLHPFLHGTPGRPQQHVSDVLRGAVVLATAALDALVLDTMAEAIPHLAKKGLLGPGVNSWVKRDAEEVLACFATADPCQALGDFCRQQLGPLTFQRAKMIEATLAEVTGCKAPWDRAAAALSRPGEDWTGQRVSEQLDIFVQRRNRIAHSGDLKPGGGRTATESIQLNYVDEAVRVIRAVGEAISWCVATRIRARTPTP